MCSALKASYRFPFAGKNGNVFLQRITLTIPSGDLLLFTIKAFLHTDGKTEVMWFP